MEKNKNVFYVIIINEKIPVFGDLNYLPQFFLLQSAFLSHVLFMFEQFLHLLPLFSGFDIFIPFFVSLLNGLSGRMHIIFMLLC